MLIAPDREDESRLLCILPTYAMTSGICAKIRYRLETIGMRATMLTVETGKQMTGLLVSAPIPIPADNGEYQPIPVSV